MISPVHVCAKNEILPNGVARYFFQPFLAPQLIHREPRWVLLEETGACSRSEYLSCSVSVR